MFYGFIVVVPGFNLPFRFMMVLKVFVILYNMPINDRGRREVPELTNKEIHGVTAFRTWLQNGTGEPDLAVSPLHLGSKLASQEGRRCHWHSFKGSFLPPGPMRGGEGTPGSLPPDSKPASFTAPGISLRWVPF